MYKVYCTYEEEGGKVPEKKKKMGRPTIDNEPMNIRVQLRMDKTSLEKLDRLAQEKKMNRSEYIRQLIKKAK